MSEVSIGPGPPDEGEQIVLGPIARREFGDDLL